LRNRLAAINDECINDYKQEHFIKDVLQHEFHNIVFH